MDQIDDGEHVSFISRCVENDPNANTDDEEDTLNNKSGMYIKFFCEDHQEWEDKCCKSDWKWLTFFTMNKKNIKFLFEDRPK